MVRRIFVIDGGIEPLITAEGLLKMKEVDLRVDLLANGKCHRFAVHAQQAAGELQLLKGAEGHIDGAGLVVRAILLAASAVLDTPFVGNLLAIRVVFRRDILIGPIVRTLEPRQMVPLPVELAARQMDQVLRRIDIVRRIPVQLEPEHPRHRFFQMFRLLFGQPPQAEFASGFLCVGEQQLHLAAQIPRSQRQLIEPVPLGPGTPQHQPVVLAHTRAIRTGPKV